MKSKNYSKEKGSRVEVCQNPFGTVNPVPYIREVDIVIRENLTTLNPPIPGGYNFNRNINPNANEMDFYSVILHELGHAHLIKHAIGPNKIMFWQLQAGNTRRNISVDDANGGSYLLDASIILLNQAFCPSTVVPISDQVVACAVSTFEVVPNYLSISITPNPFSDKLDINFELEKQTNLINWKIYNAFGQEVRNGELEPIAGENKLSITRLSNLPHGLYYFSLLVDNVYNTYKILK